MRIAKFTKAILIGVPLLAAGAFARDDFLRGNSRDLSIHERQALEQRITELGNPDPALRNRAVRRLGAAGRPALPALSALLQSGSDPKQVRNACLALGAIGDPAAFAQLEKLVREGDASEEVMRAALFAVARAPGYPSPELAEALRHLATEAPLATVRESAVLAAGARRVVGLSDVLKAPLQREKSARVRGCMLVGLAEAADPNAAPLVAPFLDPRRTRDERLRRAAIYAAGRLADPALLKPMLRLEPDQHELAGWCVSLGAFHDPDAVEALSKALVHDREKAVEAVYSLANLATPEAREMLRRAIDGEFSAPVQEAACVAVSELVDQQRFLPSLRKVAAQAAPGPRAAALLALARMRDVEAATAIAPELPGLKDGWILRRGLLLCALVLDTPIERLLPQPRRELIGSLWQEIADVQQGRRDPRLVQEQVAADLSACRAHWLLRRDDLRTRTLRDLLELDRIVWLGNKDDESGGGGGSTLPPPDGGSAPPDSGPGTGGGSDSPPPGGGDGGGSGDTGSGDGSGSGGDTGGGDGSTDPPGGSPGGSPGGAKGGFDSFPSHRGKQDYQRLELDLRQFLIDFLPFERADPFGR